MGHFYVDQRLAFHPTLGSEKRYSIRVIELDEQDEKRFADLRDGKIGQDS